MTTGDFGGDADTVSSSALASFCTTLVYISSASFTLFSILIICIGLFSSII